MKHHLVIIVIKHLSIILQQERSNNYGYMYNSIERAPGIESTVNTEQHLIFETEVEKQFLLYFADK